MLSSSHLLIFHNLYRSARMCTFPVIIIVCVERIPIIFLLLFYVYIYRAYWELLWLLWLLLSCVFHSFFRSFLLFETDFVECFCFPFFRTTITLNPISSLCFREYLAHTNAMIVLFIQLRLSSFDFYFSLFILFSWLFSSFSLSSAFCFFVFFVKLC